MTAFTILTEAIRLWLTQGTLSHMVLITPSTRDFRRIATGLAIATGGIFETGHCRIDWPGGAVCTGMDSMFPNRLDGLLVDTAVAYDPDWWSNQEEIADLLVLSLRFTPQRWIVWRPGGTPELLLIDQETFKTEENE